MIRILSISKKKAIKIKKVFPRAIIVENGNEYNLVNVEMNSDAIVDFKNDPDSDVIILRNGNDSSIQISKDELFMIELW